MNDCTALDSYFYFLLISDRDRERKERPHSSVLLFVELPQLLGASVWCWRLGLTFSHIVVLSDEFFHISCSF